MFGVKLNQKVEIDSSLHEIESKQIELIRIKSNRNKLNQIELNWIEWKQKSRGKRKKKINQN